MKYKITPNSLSRYRRLRMHSAILGAALFFVPLAWISTPLFADVPRTGAVQEIIGGVESAQDAQPWMVALVRNTSRDDIPISRRQFCGGVVVSSEWILTAAHCVLRSTIENTSVIIGRHNIDEAAADQRAISQIVVHPKYNSRTFENDVAMLKLAQSTQAQPIEIVDTSKGFELGGQVGRAFGWGQAFIAPGNCAAEFSDSQVKPADYDCRVHDFERGSRQVQDRLLQADITLLSDAACNSRIRDLLEFLQIDPGDPGRDFTPENQICTFDPAENKGVCFGDSGGPLTIEQNGRTVLVGTATATYGAGGCAREFSTDIFTLASAYEGFMDEVMHRDLALSFESFCPPMVVPIVKFDAASGGLTRTTLSWSPYKQATQYILRYSLAEGGSVDIATIKLDASLDELSAELEPGTEFFVAVQAENESCTGPISEVLRVQVPNQ